MVIVIVRLSWSLAAAPAGIQSVGVVKIPPVAASVSRGLILMI